MDCSSPLCQRTLTALLLGPLVMGAVLVLPSAAFALFLGLVILGGAWEWGGLAGLATVRQRAAYVAAIGVFLLGLWLLPIARLWLVGGAALWWAFQTVALTRVRGIAPEAGPTPSLLPIGLLVLGAPWAALVDLHQRGAAGPWLVLFLMLLIWTADIAAYFVGRRFGRVKLAPQISPGKSREGVYGALAGGCLGGLALGWGLSLGVGGTLLAVALCAATVVLSVAGDLYESLLKRRRGLKDSSNLLPGHGGLLDRIDSATAAAPVFALGLVLIASVLS